MGECFIVRRGGEANKLPVLNPSLPADVSVIEAAGAYADFSVGIDEPGVPAEYTYTWYLDGSEISGETGANVRILGLTSEAVHSVYCTVANRAGLVRSRTAVLTVESCLPQLSYTGQSEVVDDGDYNWRVKFLTSGNVTFNRAPGNVDVFLVGGGANPSGNDGGGSGYTQTYYAVQLDAEKYQVEIGSAGGTTNAFGCSAEGGAGSTVGVAAEDTPIPDTRASAARTAAMEAVTAQILVEPARGGQRENLRKPMERSMAAAEAGAGQKGR